MWVTPDWGFDCCKGLGLEEVDLWELEWEGELGVSWGGCRSAVGHNLNPRGYDIKVTCTEPSLRRVNLGENLRHGGLRLHIAFAHRRCYGVTRC